jgi:hypothetical protein
LEGARGGPGEIIHTGEIWSSMGRRNSKEHLYEWPPKRQSDVQKAELHFLQRVEE